MLDVYSKHPSFSSTLLDAIYRSIDQPAVNEESMVTCGEKIKDLVEEEGAHSQRISPALEENYISSSWDSAGDSFYGKKLKPIRVWDSGLDHKDNKLIDCQEKPNKDSKKNSRALKMYAGLKNLKQPISPGAARLTGFWNSLFSGSKKPTLPDINSPVSKSADSSACSSASSFSRSCLSRGKPNGGEKRSVRFSPVSVILNQNTQSRGNKSSPKTTKNKNQKLEAVENSARNSIISAPDIDEQMLLHAKDMNKRVEEAARDLLRIYQKKLDCDFPFDFRKSHKYNQLKLIDQESEEYDDAASYASSDLFELKNLSAVEMERYELPVYETTRLPLNGLIL